MRWGHGGMLSQLGHAPQPRTKARKSLPTFPPNSYTHWINKHTH